MPALLGLVILIAILGYGFSVLPGRGIQAVAPDVDKASPTTQSPQGSAGFAELAESRRETSEAPAIELLADPQDTDAPKARKVLKEAEERIKAKQYNDAITVLNQELDLMRRYPESYVLIGRALEGRMEPTVARDFYRMAIDQNPYLPDAYWGFATASETLGDLHSALGGMRSFLHNVPVVKKNELRIAQARSAIWEWESLLGRGAWGPTKGVPPGFSADEIKRDGKGVGVKMQVPGTEGPDGKMKAEIKHAKKFKIFNE